MPKPDLNKIKNLDDATQHFQNSLEIDSEFLQIEPRLDDKDQSICQVINVVVEDVVTQRYYVFFKRDWFHQFGKQFNIPGEDKGQTFHYGILQQAGGDTDILPSIVMVMPDESIYYAKGYKLLNYVRKNNTTDKTAQEGAVPAALLSEVDDYFETAPLDPDALEEDPGEPVEE